MWVRGDDPFEDYYEWAGVPNVGEAHGLMLPFNLLDEEAERVMQELKAIEARRIPLGFRLPGQ